MSAFRGCVALLTLACCLSLWLAPAVAMQDYPQHLFLSTVLGAPDAAWTQAYATKLSWQPYSGLYWVLIALSSVLGADAAGRSFVTVYFVLFAGVALRLARDKTQPPWAALWLFPFALNQAYFHGFLSYLVTLPLLLLALLQLRGSRTQRWNAKASACHTALLLLIAWFHPFTVYVYAGLAAAEIAFSRSEQTARVWRALPGVVVSVLLVSWQLLFYRDSPGFKYWPFADTLGYFGQLVVGLRASPASVLGHVIGYAAVVIALVRAHVLSRLDRRDVLQVCLVLLAYTLLPYQVGSYSYVNWRLAPVAFMLIAVALAQVPLPRVASGVMAIVGVAFAVDACYLQLQVGRESGELLALVDKVPVEPKVVSLALDSSSRYLHPKFFYLMHRHEIFYYQLASKAVSPHLWHVALMPVRYKAGRALREPRSLQELIAQDYPLVFVRGATPALALGLSGAYAPIADHGQWVVLERRHALASP